MKLSGGEYIALERLEAIYKSCNLVANLCVYGHPDAKQPMAVIIPNEAHLKHALRQRAVDGVDADASLHTLCGNPEVAKLVLENCNALGKRNGLKPLEILESVVLTDEEWTPQSGLVTAAQKLQRKKIHETFESEIKASVQSFFFCVHGLTGSFRVYRKYILTELDDGTVFFGLSYFCLLVICHGCVHDFVIISIEQWMLHNVSTCQIPLRVRVGQRRNSREVPG